jgi:magnesium chelatase family protein
MLDRIDIEVNVPSVKYCEINGGIKQENSTEIRERIMRARAIQVERFSNKGFFSNSSMHRREIEKHCRIDKKGKYLLETAILKLGISARGHDRILKISRTIADLEGSVEIRMDHLSESIQYRIMDKKDFYGN